MVQEDVQSEHQMEEQGPVRVLLVGDPGVGKTSLIHTLVNDEFESCLPGRTGNVKIPAEVTSENVPLHIQDFSNRYLIHEEQEEAIEIANVICIVFNAGDYESLARVASYWIPRLRQSQLESEIYKPIILVANKLDLVEENSLIDQITSIIQKFVEVEAYIEVSALTQKNVVELFSSAQKVVLYPLAPLFDTKTRVLSPKCQKALVNIFRQCDIDRDGLLSDHELNLFQEDVFGIPLQRDALDDLKSIIEQSTMDGIVNDGMTQTGFLFLHTLSIDKGRHDFTWQVLRKFNYDNQINLIERTEHVDESIDDYSRVASSQLEKTYIEPNGSDSNSPEDPNDSLNLFKSNWLQDRYLIIKAGIGLATATLVGVLALRYLAFRGSRTSA